MNQAEYWLLDIVVDHAEPVRMLMPPESADGKHSDASSREEDAKWHFAVAFNRGSHGLGPNELADALCELFAQNYLVAQWDTRNPYKAATEPFMPTRAQVVEALQDTRSGRQQGGAPKLFYQLTPQGGAAWEVAAQPDWDLFVRSEEAYGDTWEEAFACSAFADYPEDEDLEEAEEDNAHLQPSQADGQDTTEPYETTQRLHVRMAGLHHGLIANYLSLDRDYLKVVVEGSEQWMEWTPWQATYWKTLPCGCEARYSIYSVPELAQRNNYFTSHAALRSRHDRMAMLWYTDYITGSRMA